MIYDGKRNLLRTSALASLPHPDAVIRAITFTVSSRARSGVLGFRDAVGESSLFMMCMGTACPMSRAARAFCHLSRAHRKRWI